ncbi:13381_t:CDS:2, partial [Cetraspora pellucida]
MGTKLLTDSLKISKMLKDMINILATKCNIKKDVLRKLQITEILQEANMMQVITIDLLMKYVTYIYRQKFYKVPSHLNKYQPLEFIIIEISKLIAENNELKKKKAEFLAKEAGLIARIVELECMTKENIKHKAEGVSFAEDITQSQACSPLMVFTIMAESKATEQTQVSYSAREISSLTNAQIQNITHKVRALMCLNQVNSKTVPLVNDQTKKILPKTETKVSMTTKSISLNSFQKNNQDESKAQNSAFSKLPEAEVIGGNAIISLEGSSIVSLGGGSIVGLRSDAIFSAHFIVLNKKY